MQSMTASSGGVRRHLFLLGTLFSLSLVAPAMADDSSRPQDGTANDRTAAEAKEAADRATEETRLWKIVLEDRDQTAAVVEKSAGLRWSWSNDGRYYGGVYIYTANRRPVAIMQFFQWFEPIQGVYFSGTSLSDVPMTATREERVMWSPRKNDIEIRDVPETPAPENTPAARLAQMRRIAEKFQFEVVDKRVTVARRQLRFLPRPIFRFAEKTDGVFDGAIFAYVATSNDPAAMVILEAVRTENESRWRYGIPSAWSFAAKATFDEKTIWEVEDAYPFKDPQSSFYLDAIPNKGK
jgi:hypothetical protein